MDKIRKRVDRSVEFFTIGLALVLVSLIAAIIIRNPMFFLLMFAGIVMWGFSLAIAPSPQDVMVAGQIDRFKERMNDRWQQTEARD